MATRSPEHNTSHGVPTASQFTVIGSTWACERALSDASKGNNKLTWSQKGIRTSPLCREDMIRVGIVFEDAALLQALAREVGISHPRHRYSRIIRSHEWPLPSSPQRSVDDQRGSLWAVCGSGRSFIICNLLLFLHCLVQTDSQPGVSCRPLQSKAATARVRN